MSTSPVVASRDVQHQDSTASTVMADASRIGNASLTALQADEPWGTAEAKPGTPFNIAAPEVDAGSLFIGLGLLALVAARPASRLLRRLEQQRRATALASSLEQSPRG
ncbi:hypothetical protein DBR42_15125 [Pelomonas sp. HMWF004]|nr:hypothetical protein DBR42_15125 [Pelomonas sp. HMWF004]